MNIYLLTIIYGFILIAGLMAWFIVRDSKNPNLFFGRFKIISVLLLAMLCIGMLTAFYSTLIEPFILKISTVNIQNSKIDNLKIAFVSDIQVGNHKKSAWVEKIVARIESANPDLVIFGGDLIDNEATFEDESKYLEPLKDLVGRYPIYYILGNHEYGIGGTVRNKPEKYTGDRSQLLINRMRTFNITLLRNTLDCPEIKGQKICLFGIDDIWKYQPDFSELKNWDKTIPLIYITHNPDGILYYPTNLPAPDLVLTGHTHGGQIWIPFFGPLGDAQIILDKSFYRGLNYFHNIPIYTSVGAGESGAPLRLLAQPEIVIITLSP